MRILGVIFTCLIFSFVSIANEPSYRDLVDQYEVQAKEQNDSVRNTVIGGAVLGGNFLTNSLLNRSQSTILQSIADEKKELNKNAAIRNSQGKKSLRVKKLKAEANIMRSNIATKETQLRNRSYGHIINVITGGLALGTAVHNGVEAFTLRNELDEIVNCHPELLTGKKTQPISKQQEVEYGDLVKPVAIMLEAENN